MDRLKAFLLEGNFFQAYEYLTAYYRHISPDDRKETDYLFELFDHLLPQIRNRKITIDFITPIFYELEAFILQKQRFLNSVFMKWTHYILAGLGGILARNLPNFPSQFNSLNTEWQLLIAKYLIFSDRQKEALLLTKGSIHKTTQSFHLLALRAQHYSLSQDKIKAIIFYKEAFLYLPHEYFITHTYATELNDSYLNYHSLFDFESQEQSKDLVLLVFSIALYFDYLTIYPRILEPDEVNLVQERLLIYTNRLESFSNPEDKLNLIRLNTILIQHKIHSNLPVQKELEVLKKNSPFLLEKLSKILVNLV